jgi:outer membrane protein OmpA-like peptidoglycan-associated protein
MPSKKDLFMKAGIVGLAASMTAACAIDDPNRRAKTGAAIGALAGAVLGHQLDGDKGRYFGAVVGGIAGGAVGGYMDDQQAELERQLAAEQAAELLKISRLPDGSLRIGIASEASFDVNKSTIRSDAQQTYNKIANVLVDYDKSIVHIIGHTDSTGTAEHNQTLSEARARSVADSMSYQGVPRDRLRTEGRGEFEPVASNDTAQGRTRNRRVDIVIKPVVQGSEEEAYRRPGFLGR